MRVDALNSHVYPVRMEMTATKQIPTSNGCSTDESKLNEFLADKTLFHICSADKDESKRIIVDKCPMEEDESECVHKNINKQKDAKNETEYEESSVTHEVPSYFNIFDCGRNLLNRLDVKYERACMATTKEKYYTKILETLVDNNDPNNSPLSNEKILQAVSTFMAETEGGECIAKRNANNVTMYNFYHQSPVITNTQGEIINVTNERRISSDILEKTIKVFNGLMIRSTINDSSY